MEGIFNYISILKIDGIFTILSENVSSHSFEFIFNLLLILFVAWVGGLVANRIGYPSILGELLAGMVFGPAVFGLIEATEGILILAEVGVILMMFYIGMEIDYQELKKASWGGLLAAIGGFITPFALGYYTIIYFTGDTKAALFVAIAMGVTSLATKSRILVDLKILDTKIAHVLMAGALISDTLALIIFAGIISMADAEQIAGSAIIEVTIRVLIFFLVTGLIGIYLMPALGEKLKKSTTFHKRSFNFTLLLFIIFIFAALAELAGLHAILGAFLAGLFVKDYFFTPKDFKALHQIFYDMSIGFLAPIFFVTAGFQVDFGVFQTDLLLLTIIIVLATVGKIVGTMLFYLPSGSWREGITIGTGMNGRGAVEIIIASIALEKGIIEENIFSILVFMAIFTTATVPVLLTKSTDWLRKRGELTRSSDKKKGTLILGASPTARLIAQFLNKQERVLLFDTNKDACAAAKAQGLKVVNESGINEDILEKHQAASYHNFIATTANAEINILAAQVLQEQFLIENIHIALSKEHENSHVELVKKMNLSTLFAGKTELDFWDNVIRRERYEQHYFEVKEALSGRDLLKKLLVKKKYTLPILVLKSEANNFEIFHFNTHLEKADEVIYLTAE